MNYQKAQSDPLHADHPDQRPQSGFTIFTFLTTLFGLVVERAYRRKQYDFVRRVLTMVPGLFLPHVLRYLPLPAVLVLLSRAIEAADIDYVLILLLEKCDTDAEWRELTSVLGVDGVKRLLSSGCDVNAVDANGRSLLWYASYVGQLDVVSMLLRANADVNVKDLVNFNALHCACERDHASVVQLLLNHQAAVNQTNTDGVTALYIASQNGHTAVVQLLLDHQAAVNQAQTKGATPLYISSQNGHTPVVQLLLDHQAAVNQAQTNGRTPLYIASQNGHTAVVQLLLDHQAAMNQAQTKGATPLYISSQNGHTPVVQLLLYHKAAVNQSNTDGVTPLSIASEDGHTAVVQLLLDHQAAVNQADTDGDTALYISSQNGHTSVVQLLLDHQAAVNQSANDGVTPLFISSQNGHASVVQLLLDHKAAVNQANLDGVTPLSIASEDGHTAVVQLLLHHQAAVNQADPDGVTPLYFSSQNGHTPVVQLLLDYKASVNQANLDGATPLYISSQNGHTLVVQLLLHHQAAVNQADPDGLTPLYLSSQNGHIPVVQLLLDHKAAVNQANINEVTPLICASANGHLDIVQLLIIHKADIYYQSVQSVTPFFAACAVCHYDVVEYFLQYLNIANKADLGHTPLHASVFLSREEIERYFRNLILESKSIDELKLIKPKFDVLEIPIAKRVQVVKLLLQSGCIKDINERTDAGETAHFLACSQGYNEIADMLQRAGADITLADFVGCSPLATAVIHGHLHTVKWLLTFPQTNVDSTDYAGCTPLYRAAEFNRVEIVSFLVKKGCNMNITDNDHMSPLAVACKSGHIDIVVLILEHNSFVVKNKGKKQMKRDTVIFMNKKGVSVVDFTCEGGDHHILKLLMDRGIDPTTADAEGNISLHRACQHLRVECVKVLLKKVQVWNAVNKRGESPIMMIPYGVSKVDGQENRVLKIAECLIKAGANVNLRDYKGYTALFRACETNNISVASMFVDHGARTDIKDNLGRSILHAAVTSNSNLPSHGMIDWIIDCGVDVNQKDNSGMTVLHLSVLLERTEITSYLVNKGADLLAPDKLGIASICHLTKYPETFKSFLPQIREKLSRTMVTMCHRFSFWWRTCSYSGIKKELEDLSGSKLDDPDTHQFAIERTCTTVNDLANWKKHIQMNSQHLLNLIDKYGRVTDTETAKTVISHLDAFINAIAQKISPNAAFKPVKAGSLSEGTKAMQPDEGDYILQQCIISISDLDLPEKYVKSADFGRLKVKKELVSEYQEKYPQVLTTLVGSKDVYLNRNGLFQNSYRYVGIVFNDPEFWDQFSMFYRLSCKDVCPDDVSIRHLDLIYSDANYAWMPLDVDLVPAIDCPCWHPPWCRQDEFCQKYLRKNGCRFIAKWAIGAHDDPTLFRISFEKCEKELFHTMPMFLKKAYQLGKILKSLCPKILKSTGARDKPEEFEWLEGISSFLTSYHMKTTIFGLYEEYCMEYPDHPPQSSEFDIEQVIHYTRLMFARLTECYKKQNLRNFWLPGENLLIDAKYGTYGWCASNYARLLQWMLEPGMQVPQFLKSAADTQPAGSKPQN